MAGTDLAYLPSTAEVRGRKADYLAVAQELRNAVEAIPAMAWTANPDGTNAFVSRRWAEYVGLPPGQHVFSDWEAVVHPDDLKRSTENWMHCVATGEPFEEEIRLRRADGRYRWFLDRGVAVKDEGGAIARWYGVATDIDDRKQAEASLAAIAQERSRLAGEIHDTLAQSLAIIVMQLADVETKLGSAWTLAERPLSLVRELAVESLAYARRSVSALRVPAESAALVPTLQDIVDRLRRHFDGTLSFAVSGDSAGVEQAVESAFAGIGREALTNAVKHSSASRISTELEFSRCGAVRLAVTDDGIGFDASNVRADAYGLVSMQERASRVGAALTFVTEQGAGTTVVASWAGPATLMESRQGALLHPVDVQKSLREQPSTSSLHKRVEIP